MYVYLIYTFQKKLFEHLIIYYVISSVFFYVALL